MIETISVGRNPNDVALDPPARTAFVPNTDDGTVSVIDSRSRAVTGSVEVGDGPQTVAADPSTHTAWVVNFTANSVSVLAEPSNP